MKNTVLVIFSIILFISCNKQPLVSNKNIDEIVKSSSLSAIEISNNKDIEFWKNRLKTDPRGETNLVNYATTLAARFAIYGDIDDLIKARQVIDSVHKSNTIKNASTYRTLAKFASLQHQFKNAEVLSQNALNLGENRYASELQMFDAAFELGNISTAKTLLKKLKKNFEYAYYFRLAKMHHYDGNLEEAIMALKKASELTNGNKNLEQIALSNLGDLYLHSGDFKSAFENYNASVRIDAADFHSISGLALISLYHDKNHEGAKKLLEYVKSKTKSPDVLIQMINLSQEICDNKQEKIYALEFVEKVSSPKYGNMYNKYLIALFDGILNNNQKMLLVAENELLNRKTPQTYSWLAWALHKNNQDKKALDVYKKHISEQPLEGFELFLVGKLMLSQQKKYNAERYFEAANKNSYDLNPRQRKELETFL